MKKHTDESDQQTQGQQHQPPAPGQLPNLAGLGATRPIQALDVSFDAALPAACLQQMFGVAVPPEHFGIGDLLWAENAMRQLAGADALRAGARETLQQWYRDYARPYYFEKLRPQVPTSAESCEDGESDTGACSDQGSMH